MGARLPINRRDHTRRGLDTLTPAELRAVDLLVNEMGTSKDIAEAMGISDGTVKIYLSHAMEKLGCANRVHLVSWVLNSRMQEPVDAVIEEREKVYKERIAELVVDNAILLRRIQLLRRSTQHASSSHHPKIRGGSMEQDYAANPC